MRIVLLGAPGSGKGTQAALLKDLFNIPHISTGALLREAVAAGTALGNRARVYMDKGELVPDEVMLGLIEERLGAPDAAAGFILDGYPRNLAQAESLDQVLERIGKPVNDAILIEVDPEQVVQRIARRAAEEGRSDDTKEVVRNRLRIYEEQTAPVAGHYSGKGLLTRVLGEGSIEEVLERIRCVLQLAQGS